MLVHSHQPRKNRVAGQVDLTHALWNPNGGFRSDSGNLTVVDQDGLIGFFWRASAINDAHVRQRKNWVAEGQERLNARF